MKPFKKKILFIITHLELGGAQGQLLLLVKNLDRNKYSLYLSSGDQGYLKEEFLKLPYLHIKLIPELIRNINPFYDFIAFLKLYFYIKKNKFDIVHTNSPKASILGRWAAYLAGVKGIIYTVHGWPFHKFMNPIVHYLYILIEKVTAKITKKIIVVSEADLRTGIENEIADKNRIFLVHYGIEIDKFNKVYDQRSEIFPGNTVFTISSFKPQKDIFNFLKLAKMLLDRNPQLNFIIAGDGPLRKRVEKRIELLGLSGKVHLKGWSDDVSLLFKMASLFVLTSLWEGLPVSLIEAVVSGVPVVVTNTGGIFDIVKSGNQGVVVNPTNILEIESACWEILKNYDNWSTIVRNGRKKLNLKYWSFARTLREIENIYATI
ncbi:MAG: glycosyltransferase family 4 protein [Candidatus Omnitrophica bacterium]|nr:glycosyltransferase family 4 protein [Candidatus Omnitrophota bacterium]